MRHYLEGERLLVEFFRKFARLEYALKRAGFLEDHQDRVRVDWNGFADSIRPQFERVLQSDESLKASVEFIESEPPRKLVRSSGPHESPVCWRVAPASQGDRLRDLLVYIRRIRNNLFHGEKPRIIVGGIDRDNRDGDLLRNGLVVLEALITLDSRIQEFVEGGSITPRC